MVRSARGRRPPIGASSERRTRRSSPMRRCEPPGAMYMRRGSSASPPAASLTVSVERESRRAASDAVKPCGMCWTISEPEPRGAGRRGTSSPSAFGPPVEDAISTMRRMPGRAGAGGLSGRAAVPCGRAGARRIAGRPWRRRPASAASPTLRASSLVNASIDSPRAGLATRSIAPSASASTARAPWAGEKAETTTTGTGSALPPLSARKTPMPSRPGMARSRVMASGLCSRQAASASSPSAAVATTSKPRRPRASERMRRMSRESSATTMRCSEGLTAATGVISDRGELVGLGADEQSLGVEQDHEAIADLGDGLDRLGVGRGDRLELIARDGEDLLDVADDDAGLAGPRLDDDDLAELPLLAGGEAHAGGEVVDGDDLAAQADHAADPGHVGGDGAGLGEADDLVHRADGQRVLLAAEREDHELLRSDVGHVPYDIGRTPVCFSVSDRPETGPRSGPRVRPAEARG